MRLILLLLALPALAQQSLTLAQLEQIALQRHPAPAEAQAEIERARALVTQAGTYPNPVIGATGDHVSPNPVYRGGEVGLFVEQMIVTGGKRRLGKEVYRAEEAGAAATYQQQKLRVLTAVRTYFYRALAAERMLEVQSRLSAVAAEASGISKELANIGLADEPDVLQAEIEAQAAEMGLLRARLDRDAVWRQLAAAVGDLSLERQPLEGDLEALPQLDQAQARETALDDNPAIGRAQAEVGRAKAKVRRERAEVAPDIQVRGGFRNSPFRGLDGRAIGPEAFFDVGVEIPLFDRNRGNIHAAEAEAAGAEREVEHLKLSLEAQLAAAYRDYATSVELARRYRDDILPRAERAYRLYLAAFRRMAAAYPQVLTAQRNWFRLEQEYVRSLEAGWVAAMEIEGMLPDHAM